MNNIYIGVCVCLSSTLILFARPQIFSFWFEGLLKLSVLLKRNVRSVYKIKYYFAKLTSLIIESVKKSRSYLNYDKGLGR